MTTLEQFPSAPEADLIHRVVARLFNSSGVRGRVELSWSDPHPPHGLNQAMQFDLADLDVLCDKAISLNATPNRNVYISAGLRRVDIPLNIRGRDEDVIACVACWADFDGDGDYERAYSKVAEIGLLPNIIVITGTHPYARAQMWWVLEEPCDDLARHKSVQKHIARILNGDTTVTNSSRVMRLGGSVAWPIKKGRRVEVTALADVEMREANYWFEEIERIVLASGEADTHAVTAGQLDFNDAVTNVDVAHNIVEGLKPGQFHVNMRGAVASMLAQSTPPRVVFDVLSSMVRKEGVNVEERLFDLKRLINGAIERGIYKAAPAVPIVDTQQLKQRFRFSSHADLILREPPEWQIDGYIQRKGFAAIYAPPASYKTFIALDMALSVATGQRWHDRECRPGRVLYVASEGATSFGFRVQAWSNVNYKGEPIPPGNFAHLGEDVNMLDVNELKALIEAAQEQMEGLDLVIFDTLARSFGSGDENATKDMVTFTNHAARLQAVLGATVLMVHHTGKDESKGGRGSSALRGALDHEFRLRREPGSDLVKLITGKQKDADELPPRWFKLGRIEVTHPKTGEVRESLVPVAVSGDGDGVPQNLTRQEAYAGLRKSHYAVLEAVRDASGKLSTLTLAATLEQRPDNVARTTRALQDRGLLFQVDGFWHYARAQPVDNFDEDDEN